MNSEKPVQISKSETVLLPTYAQDSSESFNGLMKVAYSLYSGFNLDEIKKDGDFGKYFNKLKSIGIANNDFTLNYDVLGKSKKNMDIPTLYKKILERSYNITIQ